MNRFKLTLLLFFSVIQMNCSKTLDAEHYIKRIEKEHSSVILRRNGIIAKLSFLPPEFSAAKQMIIDTTVSSTKALAMYNNALTFVVTFEDKENNFPVWQKSSISNNGTTSQHIHMQEHNFLLVKSKDTIKACLLAYEQNWGYGGNNSYVITFPKMNNEIDEYCLIIRNVGPAIGTLQFPLKKICKSRYFLEDRV